MEGTSGRTPPVDPSAPVQSSDVAIFCTRIDRALEYSIDEGRHEDLYGVFTPSPEDGSKFLMEAFSILENGLVKVDPMINDSYKWEPIRKRMISSRVKVLVALSMVSPAIRDRCEILQRDLQSILLEDERSIKCVMMYVDVIYEATLKHINTEFDRDVFYNVIARRKFSTVERKLRKNLWNYDEAILSNPRLDNRYELQGAEEPDWILGTDGVREHPEDLDDILERDASARPEKHPHGPAIPPKRREGIHQHPRKSLRAGGAFHRPTHGPLHFPDRRLHVPERETANEVGDLEPNCSTLPASRRNRRW